MHCGRARGELVAAALHELNNGGDAVGAEAIEVREAEGVQDTSFTVPVGVDDPLPQVGAVRAHAAGSSIDDATVPPEQAQLVPSPTANRSNGQWDEFTEFLAAKNGVTLRPQPIPTRTHDAKPNLKRAA